MPLHVSPSNSKLGSIPSVSFPTKLCSVQCSYCYARTLEKRWPSTRKCWEENAAYFDTHSKQEVALNIALQLKGVKYFRWLVSGEFYDQHVFETAVFLAELLPQVTFMAYTKMLWTGAILRPSNFKLLYSLSKVYEDYSYPSDPPLGFDGVSVIHKTRTTCSHQISGTRCQDCLSCYRGESVILRLHK